MAKDKNETMTEVLTDTMDQIALLVLHNGDVIKDESGAFSAGDLDIIKDLQKKVESFRSSRDAALGKVSSLEQKVESTELRLYKMRDEVKKTNKAINRRNGKISRLKAKLTAIYDYESNSKSKGTLNNDTNGAG